MYGNDMNMGFVQPQERPKPRVGIVIFASLISIAIGAAAMYFYLKFTDQLVIKGSTPKTEEKSDAPASEEKTVSYEKAVYSLEQICGEKTTCEKTFNYGGKDYKLVIKDGFETTGESDVYIVTINDVDVTGGYLCILENLYFTDNGLIGVQLGDSETGDGDSITFYDTDLKAVKSYGSDDTIVYSGGYTGTYTECKVLGDEDEDQALITYEFSFTKDKKFSEKKTGEKKGFCTAQN